MTMCVKMIVTMVKNNSMGDLNDKSINVIQTKGAIVIPSTNGRTMFHVIGSIIQIAPNERNFGGYRS